MPKLKPPTPIRPPTEINDTFTLALIEGKIAEFIKYVKVACVGTVKGAAEGRDHAKFLVRDLMELKKEKALASRLSAVQQLYENFATWAKTLPEEAEEVEGMKDGDNPKRVSLKGMVKCPTGCDDKYHKKLIDTLKKPKTYTYTKSTRSWTPDMGKQTGHADGKTWKAYVDAEEGAGTKWRMGFAMDFEEVDEELTTTINYCKIGH